MTEIDKIERISVNGVAFGQFLRKDSMLASGGGLRVMLEYRWSWIWTLHTSLTHID
jgi:hypothetical protein